MSENSGAIDPSEWYGRLQRAYLASAEEWVLDELTDIGRLLAVTGIAVESVLETHGVILAQTLAAAPLSDHGDLIQAATICLSEVLVAWRMASEGLGESDAAPGLSDPAPPYFLRFTPDGGVVHSQQGEEGMPDVWMTAETLDQMLAMLGVRSRQDDVTQAIRQRRLMTFDVHPAELGERVLRAVICPFRDGGGILGIHDVSARRVASESMFQRRKLESLGQLAGGIAHEINNLLQPILTTAQFMAEDHPDDAALMEDVGIVLDSARAAANVVRDVLAFARRGVSQLAPLALAEAVEQEMAVIARSLPPGIALAVEAQGEAAIQGNRSELGQVLRNLVGNAVDAMDGHGSLTVSVAPVILTAAEAVRHAMPAGHYARLSVTDDGCGVDAATARRIFDPFFTTKEVGKGTGLGLPIVRGIVQSWGGAIAVRAGLARGAVFDILWPATQGAAPAAAPVPAAAFSGGAHIVVVEDDPRVGAAILRTLERAGYRVRLFHAPEDALRRFGKAPVHLLISDWVMPGMDGFAFIKEIRRAQGMLPTLVVSGGGLAEDDVRDKATRLGVREVLIKPVSGPRLLAAVGRCLTAAPERIKGGHDNENNENVSVERQAEKVE